MVRRLLMDRSFLAAALILAVSFGWAEEPGAAQLRQRAGSGDPAAMVQYAKELLKPPVTPIHLQEAMKLLQRAADAGNVDAMLRLSRILSDKKLMLPDYPRAFVLVKKAAENGSAMGMSVTGQFYYSGLGVPKDPVEAWRWIKKAADSGDQVAIDWLREHPHTEQAALPPAGKPASQQASSQPRQASTASSAAPAKAVASSPVPSAQPTPPDGLQITQDVLAGNRPGGEVLATKALMRMLVGPLSAAQEAQFNAQYAADYSRPTPAVVARHRRTNTLLLSAMVEREQMLRSLREYDAAQKEAQLSQAMGDTEGRNEALQIADLQNRILQDASLHFEKLSTEADAIQKAATAEKEEPAALTGSAAYRQALETTRATNAVSDAPADKWLLGRWVLDQTKIEQAKPRAEWNQRFTLNQDGGSADWVVHGHIDRPSWEKQVSWDETVRLRYSWTPPPHEIAVYGGSVWLVRKRPYTFSTTYSISSAGSGFKFATNDKEDLGAEWNVSFVSGQLLEGSDEPLYTIHNSPVYTRLDYPPVSGARDSNTETLKDMEAAAPRPRSNWFIRYETPSGQVTFIYRWFAGSTAVAETPVLDESLDEQKKAAIEEHLANIRFAQKAMEGNKLDLANATDPNVADQLRFSIVHNEQDIHDSQDLIESIKTGKDVHTRGPWEQHAEAVAAQNLKRAQEEADRRQQMQAAALRMAAILRKYAPNEAKNAHELILSQISTGIYKEGGMARAQATLDQIHQTTKKYCLEAQAVNENAQGKSAAIAANTARNVEILDDIKSGADKAVFVGSMLTPMGPGAVISIAYEGATIGIEKGPAEALKQMTKDAVMMAAMAGAMKAGEAVLGKFINPKTAVPLEDAFSAARFKQEMEFNQALVNRVKETQAGLRKASQAGATPAELARLETAATDAVSAANSSTLAKRIMKNELQSAEEAARVAQKQVQLTANSSDAAVSTTLRTESAAAQRLSAVEEMQAGYQRSLSGIYQKVDDAVVQRLRAKGYNVEKSWFKEFRNPTSKGINADRDLGLLREYENRLMMTDAKTGKTIPVLSKERFMQEAQQEYEAAYKTFNNGRSAKLADQNITTSVHSESFPLEFLDASKVGTASRDACDRAGKAIYNKVANALASSDPEFVNLQKAYASLSKDLKTKILPNLEKAKPGGVLTGNGIAKARQYWEEIAHIMDDFAKGRINPFDATQKMRLLTGGTTMKQVARKANALMGQLGR